MADDLGVRYLLEGSVRRQVDDLRITAQLVDTRDQTYLWSETYRGTLSDVFEIQEKVANKIVTALELKLSPYEEEILKQRRTENTRAYQLYLQGRFFGTREAKKDFKLRLSILKRRSRSTISMPKHGLESPTPIAFWLSSEP